MSVLESQLLLSFHSIAIKCNAPVFENRLIHEILLRSLEFLKDN